MNRCSVGEMSFTRQNCNVTFGLSIFSQIEIASKNSNIAADFVAGVDRDRPEEHRNIAHYIAVHAHRTKCTRDVTCIIAFCDGDIRSKTCAVATIVISFRKGR